MLELDNRGRKCSRKRALGRGDRNIGDCGVVYWDLEENQFNAIKKEKWKLTDNVDSESFEVIIWWDLWIFGDGVVVEDDW